MSGHNKWSTIKHRKGAQDKKRSKIFTKLIKELTVAAREGGGDPSGNPRLRRAWDTARTANMPNDTIDRAIKKGTGELEGVDYEELTYEGVGPGGTLVLVQVLTDNRNRSAPEVRRIFEKNYGQWSSVGSAAWAFDEKGVIRIPLEAIGEEALFELAGGAGAEDVAEGEEGWVVTTPRDDLDAVLKEIEAAGVEVTSSELEQIAKNPKVLDGEEARQALQLLEALDDHEDVQAVFSDFEPAPGVLEGLGAG